MTFLTKPLNFGKIKKRMGAAEAKTVRLLLFCFAVLIEAGFYESSG